MKNTQNLDENDKKKDLTDNVFSSPFNKKEKKTKTSLKEKFIKYKINILYFLIPLLLIIVVLLIITGGHKDIVEKEKRSIRNYPSGIESNIESLLFYLHNDEPLPDSVKFYFDVVSYIESNFNENCSLKRLKELLSKKGFVHSIVIESKTFKDFGINSWIYRTNFLEGDFINVEYIFDFEFKNDTIILKSFELLSEVRREKEIIGVPIKDSSNIKKKKKETEVIIIDSSARKKVDSVKKIDELKENKELKETEIKEGDKDVNNEPKEKKEKDNIRILEKDEGLKDDDKK